MKKILLAGFALIICSAAVNAAEHIRTETAFVQNGQDTKTQIEVTALPEAVRQTLASEDYAGWEVTAAWQVKSAAAEYYEIQMRRGEETATLKLDKDGKPA